MFWYFEVGFAVLEWDSVFSSTDVKRLLNLFLVPAFKRQHKDNFYASIILPLCRLQQEPNSSAFLLILLLLSEFIFWCIFLPRPSLPLCLQLLCYFCWLW